MQPAAQPFRTAEAAGDSHASESFSGQPTYDNRHTSSRTFHQCASTRTGHGPPSKLETHYAALLGCTDAFERPRSCYPVDQCTLRGAAADGTTSLLVVASPERSAASAAGDGLESSHELTPSPLAAPSSELSPSLPPSMSIDSPASPQSITRPGGSARDKLLAEDLDSRPTVSQLLFLVDSVVSCFRARTQYSKLNRLIPRWH